MRRVCRSVELAGLLLLAAGCAEIPGVRFGDLGSAQPAPAAAGAPGSAPAQAAGTVKVDPLISTTLLSILESKDRVRIDFAECGRPNPPAVCELLAVGSPIGYALRNRALNIGVPIAEGLSRNEDPVFRERLITLARWDSNPEVRAAALLAVAAFGDERHLEVLREALVHMKASVRFGAIEGLIVWGHDDKAVPLLTAASERDPEPILRVYAAAGLARLKNPAGVKKLREFLDHPTWLVRAMAGRYLGEYGMAEDYRTLVSRIGREQGNDFVVAEYCVSALKLFGRKKKP